MKALWSAKATEKHGTADESSLELFAGAILGESKDALFSTLRQCLATKWDDTYNVAVPFGDRREAGYDSVWVFDLDQDLLIQIRQGASFSVPLSLARERQLATKDFIPLVLPPPPAPSSLHFSVLHWEVPIGDLSREKAFLGRLLRDFAHAWRHLLRQQQNHATFSRLAAAVVWISSLEFVVTERIDSDHSPGGPYAWASDLPQWPCPTFDFIEAANSHFVLFQDPNEGLHEIQRHHSRLISNQATTDDAGTTYALLSLRHIILVRANNDGSLQCSKSETLFNGEEPPSTRAG